MNNLSWLIYFGDVVGGLGVVLGVLIGLCVVIGFFATLVYFAARESYEKDVAALGARFVRGVLIAGPILLVLQAVTPSKETVYMIAASEVGEDVLRSDTGRKAVAAINRYLDGVAGEEKEAD